MRGAPALFDGGAVVGTRSASRRLMIAHLMMPPLMLIAVDGETPSQTHAPADCPALFGTAQSREDNRDAREDRQLEITVDEYAVDIMHAGDPFMPPTLAHVDGVRYLGTLAPDHEHKEARAIFEVTEPRIGCEGGTYALHVDDNLAGAPILAVLREGVLVDDRDELRFVGDDMPAVRLLWRSGITIRYPVPYRAPPPPARPTPRKRGR